MHALHWLSLKTKPVGGYPLCPSLQRNRDNSTAANFYRAQVKGEFPKFFSLQQLGGTFRPNMQIILWVNRQLVHQKWCRAVRHFHGVRPSLLLSMSEAAGFQIWVHLNLYQTCRRRRRAVPGAQAIRLSMYDFRGFLQTMHGLIGRAAMAILRVFPCMIM